MKFSCNPNASVQRCLKSLFQRSLSLLLPLCQRYLQAQVTRINKMLNSVNNALALQDQPHGYILSYFYKLLRALSLSRIHVEFSLKLIYFTMSGKNFQIYCVHIPRKCIESNHFQSCPPSPLKTPKVLSIRSQAEGNYSFPQAAFLHKSFPPTAEMGEENYGLLYQNSIRKYKDDLEYQFICILSDF